MTDDRVPSPTLEEWATKRDVVCVVCPDCAFTFDAGHTDEPGGGYSCPLCAELALLERVRGTEQENELLEATAVSLAADVEECDQWRIRAESAEAQVVALREALREIADAVVPGDFQAEGEWAIYQELARICKDIARHALADLPLPAPELSGD